MLSSGTDQVDQIDPEQAWNELEQQETSVLVDVRTEPEWRFVGVPDLTSIGRQVILAEWRRYPDMRINESFADQVLGAAGRVPDAIYFLCRSGARSMEAATAMAHVMADRGTPIRCVNVAEGFEGDLDGARHRGSHNGWKARGLDWKQS